MRKVLLFGCAMLMVVGLRAQEQVNLTVPEVKPTNSSYHVSQLVLSLDDLSITVLLRGSNGEALTKVYNSASTPSGATLLHNLNTGNFSVNSLMKAVYNRLLTDGVLTGTIAGTPQ